MAGGAKCKNLILVRLMSMKVLTKFELRDMKLETMACTKGAKEVTSFYLDVDDFLGAKVKETIEQVDRDPTLSLVAFGPAKAAKTMLLKLLAWRKSVASIAAAADALRQAVADAEEAGDQEEVVKAEEEYAEFVRTNPRPGFLVTNAPDNFGRVCVPHRPMILDDPLVEAWKQSDWLSWCDLLAEGSCATTRFTNTELGGWRSLASNETQTAAWGKFAKGKLNAILNKTLVLDLWQPGAMADFRRSPWYNDKETGEPVSLCLTRAGEIKVRTHLGLPSPDVPELPAVVAEAIPAADTSPRRELAAAMGLSPNTAERLHTAISPNLSGKLLASMRKRPRSPSS